MNERPNQQPDQPEEPDEQQEHGPWDPNEQVGNTDSVEITAEGQHETADLLRRPKPSVWIACLAAYNNGTLHGDWVDAAVSAEELIEAAQRILAASPEPGAEEWAIFDYDEFGAFKVGEYESLETVARVARGIAEHGQAFAAWAQFHDADPDMLEQFEDAYLGEYDSTEDWARQVMDEINLDQFLGQLPRTVQPYVRIDYAAWARDAQLGGEIHTEEADGGGIYVFLVQ